MSQMIESFINKFAGYGNKSASRWFVGMEEAGVNSIEDLQRRVSAWHSRGSSVLEDLADFHRDIGETKLFEESCPIQRTWAGLLRFDAGFCGTSGDVESIRRAQATSLGRKNGDTALVELFPLPAASTRHWPYSPLAPSIPSLASRESYREKSSLHRMELLSSLISKAKPKVVLFYGASYLNYWRELSSCFHDGTAYLVSPHPVARGLTNEFWLSCGRHAAEISN